MQLDRKCDVFIGFAAAGVVKQPKEDPQWLMTHCWLCERSVEEIEAAGDLVETGEIRG